MITVNICGTVKATIEFDGIFEYRYFETTCTPFDSILKKTKLIMLEYGFDTAIITSAETGEVLAELVAE